MPIADRIRTAAALSADLVCVAVFVLIGRGSHGESPVGFVVTFWPFVVGLLAGWAVARAWRAPFGLPAALVVVPVTVLVGMLLRAVSGQGVQPAFVVVATIALALFLLGWRGVAALVRRGRPCPR